MRVTLPTYLKLATFLAHADDHEYSEQSVPNRLETCFRLFGSVTWHKPGLTYLLRSFAQAVNRVFQHEELVAAVLGRIGSLRDLLRCSAVNRCWHSASKSLRPTSLEIPGYYSDEYIDFDDIVRWMQQKHQQQYFDKLQNLTLFFSESAAVADDVHALAACGLAILTLAGLWPLKACSIEGPFDVGQIAGLLPHTLHHLHVQVDIEHRNYHSVGIGIGIFQRFRSLRSLHLSAFEYVRAADFQMQSPMVLPNLRHLHLSPWPFKHSGTLADSFPLLTHAALHIHATAFAQYVKLPHIEYLGLKIGRLGKEAVHMNVKVDADSHLNCLVLSVPDYVKLDVSLDKPNLMYRIRGSGGTTCVCSPANLQRVYQLPKHFRTL